MNINDEGGLIEPRKIEIKGCNHQKRKETSLLSSIGSKSLILPKKAGVKFNDLFL